MLTSQQDRAAFAQDGVVCLKGQIAPNWLDLIAKGIERNKARPGPFFRDNTPEGSPARYIFDFWTWRDIPEFGEVIYKSPAAQLAGELLNCQETTLIMDNWFLREAGATNGAPWHHDEPYFDVQGRLINILIPLEAAKASEFLSFVKGSHRWGKLFMAQHFRDKTPFEGQSESENYWPVPNVAEQVDPADIISFDLDPGDCLAFDLRTLHGATEENRPLPRTIHRFSLRFAAEGARFEPRGPWTQEISDHLRALGQVDGAPLATPLTPRIWQAQ